MLACSGRPYDTLDEVIGTRAPMNVRHLNRRGLPIPALTDGEALLSVWPALSVVAGPAEAEHG